MDASRHYPLDLLRGVCALGIAAYHYLAWGHGFVIQSLGTFGVYTFFVLSAVAMMMRYEQEFCDTISARSLRQFFQNRVARILPILAIASFAAYLYYDGQGSKSLESAILSATGLFALHMPGNLATAPGAWSLGIELMFYAVFPAICLLTSGLTLRSLLGIAVALIVAQQLLLLSLPAPSSPEFWGQYSLPLMFAPFFALGLAIHRATFARTTINAALAFLALGACFAFSLAFRVDLFEGGLAYVALTLICALSVLLAYRSTIPRWMNGGAWFLGEISYALYLSHWAAWHLSRHVWGPRWLAFGISAILLATALTFLVDRPLRARLRSSKPPADQLMQTAP